ncbi:putative tRNA-specific adenosine deaminase [Triangularia verruculosa]|uniref:tRNA-specific adenosine deaminase n=1 Tax=Triangularia verruculosa TaxID=2587418 RepID=A0AAN7AVI1_9PEZI|nr:putative tRNA-specific adenosine deaminase [Triangularia verruculosa]
MTVAADEVAIVVLSEFQKLPAKRKPAIRDNGLHEWVPLSGIVAKGPDFLKCVALATGMKCLPASKLPQANGVAIHDWHAEVLALRAFNRFLLDECKRLTFDSTFESDFLCRTSSSSSSVPPFTWRPEVSLHMYCSEAPCGDSSMELTMASQTDSTPWSSPIPVSEQAEGQLLGRGYFSQLGIVRRKPSRPDAPPTSSKSCSDKIALKQCTSLLSSLTSLLVSPENLYLSSLILPESQYSETGCTRCYGFEPPGRMSCLTTNPPAWENGYKPVPFSIETTQHEFDYSRRAVTAISEKISPSNLAVCWTYNKEVEEGIIGGVLQGRKAFDFKGASAVSRKKMWALALEVAEGVYGPEGQVTRELKMGTYDEVKEKSVLLQARRRVKNEVRREALKSWVRNTGDRGFSL